jgi:hypothetical protein
MHLCRGTPLVLSTSYIIASKQIPDEANFKNNNEKGKMTNVLSVLFSLGCLLPTFVVLSRDQIPGYEALNYF